MKRIFSGIAYLLFFCNYGWAQNIVGAEYFIDIDPGAGKGTPITVASPGEVISLTTTIPATSLTKGFHFVAIRTKGADGVWGLYEARGFYVTEATVDAANITGAEYFLDTDPGVGKGTTLNIGTSGGTVNFTATIPQNLSPGFHFVAIRTKGADGVWGLFEARGFYVTQASADAANITAAEYFLDTDPGVGKGTAMNIGTSGGTVNFTATIPQNLSPGFHFVAIRTKGADGVWGLYEARGFYVSESVDDAGDIAALEYFFDADPGVGKATPISVSPTTPLFDGSLSIPIGSLSVGKHFIGIRARDTKGKWGLIEYREFDVDFPSSIMNLSEGGLLVYPTLTTGKVVIQSPKPITIQIVGMNGQRYEQVQIRETGQIDLTDKPAGVYLLKLIPQNKVIKVVKY